MTRFASLWAWWAGEEISVVRVFERLVDSGPPQWAHWGHIYVISWRRKMVRLWFIFERFLDLRNLTSKWRLFYSHSRRDVMRLSNKRSPYLFGVATANMNKGYHPKQIWRRDNCPYVRLGEWPYHNVILSTLWNQPWYDVTIRSFEQLFFTMLWIGP